MNMEQLAPNLFVGAQIVTEDLPFLSKEGFTDVICNRPDAEHPDGPVSQIMAGQAEKAQLAFHYLPIVPGEPFVQQAHRMAAVVSRPGAKVFAYCRSGARSTNAWKLAQDATVSP